jgi:hypothetical protein
MGQTRPIHHDFRNLIALASTIGARSRPLAPRPAIARHCRGGAAAQA